MERLDADRHDDRTPRLLVGAGIVSAGVTLVTLGGLGALGAVFSPPIAFGAAAGFTLAVLLAGAGLSLGTTPSRDAAVAWERSTPAPTHVTDGSGDRTRRPR